MCAKAGTVGFFEKKQVVNLEWKGFLWGVSQSTYASWMLRAKYPERMFMVVHVISYTCSSKTSSALPWRPSKDIQCQIIPKTALSSTSCNLPLTAKMSYNTFQIISRSSPSWLRSKQSLPVVTQWGTLQACFVSLLKTEREIMRWVPRKLNKIEILVAKVHVWLSISALVNRKIHLQWLICFQFHSF